jgi:hypothetical protein
LTVSNGIAATSFRHFAAAPFARGVVGRFVSEKTLLFLSEMW